MAAIEFVEYENTSAEFREVYDDIMATRKVDWINHFWKALALQPELLKRTWNGFKEVMVPEGLTHQNSMPHVRGQRG